MYCGGALLEDGFGPTWVPSRFASWLPLRNRSAAGYVLFRRPTLYVLSFFPPLSVAFPLPGSRPFRFCPPSPVPLLPSWEQRAFQGFPSPRKERSQVGRCPKTSLL